MWQTGDRAKLAPSGLLAENNLFHDFGRWTCALRGTYWNSENVELCDHSAEQVHIPGRCARRGRGRGIFPDNNMSQYCTVLAIALDLLMKSES